SPILDDDQQAVNESVAAVPVDEKTPIFRNIYMRDITATSSNTATKFQGLPEMKLENVQLENAVLEAENGITIIDAKGIKTKNVKVLTQKGAALTIYNAKDVDIKQLSTNEVPAEPVIRVLGNASDNVRVEASNIAKDQVVKGKDVPKKAVTIK